jgi:hypothetical protein
MRPVLLTSEEPLDGRVDRQLAQISGVATSIQLKSKRWGFWFLISQWEQERSVRDPRR